MSNTATILVLEAQNVGYSANKKTILRSVSFTLKKGRIYALLGPNGGGGQHYAHQSDFGAAVFARGADAFQVK
ncbi:hypothetical protein [Eisenibacter elegans]|uniref:hypothetical protein n=1 Tax=Eisenibacter elegans TaxID=997 RepID=UPI00040AAE39|nr:hypothetical protein [Eisenibacter elegans]